MTSRPSVIVCLPFHPPPLAVQSPQVLLVPNSSVMKAGCFHELEKVFGVPQIGADALRRRLKLKDGGRLHVFATTVGKGHYLFLTERCATC